MSERLTDAKIVDIENDPEAGHLVRWMAEEIRERRQADLTAEEREALDHHRTIRIHVGCATCRQARAAIDKLTRSGK